MLTKQCISVTDLKKNTSMYIKSLKTDGAKTIFINNKPVAMLIDIEQFDLHIEEPYQFQFPE